MEMLLEQTQGTGVDVYTHSEMLPAQYYPCLLYTSVDGIESNIPINLSGEEALKLKKSADSLTKIIETIEL